MGEPGPKAGKKGYMLSATEPLFKSGDKVWEGVRIIEIAYAVSWNTLRQEWVYVAKKSNERYYEQQLKAITSEVELGEICKACEVGLPVAIECKKSMERQLRHLEAELKCARAELKVQAIQLESTRNMHIEVRVV